MAPPAGNWSLVFEDQFVGSVPDPSTYWFYPCWGNQNDPQEDPAFLQGDTTTAGMSGLSSTADTEAGGRLLLTGSATSTRYGGQTFPYRSGWLRTKANWLYGYVEGSLTPAAGQGMWTTFWMMPPVYNDQVAWEIDIAEFPGSATTLAYQNIHWGVYSEGHQDLTNVSGDFSTAPHTYGVEWKPTFIKWYIDGTLVKTYNGPNIPNTEMQVLMTLNLGGPTGWVNPFDGSTPLPRASTFEYVRVYQEAASSISMGRLSVSA